MNKEKFFGINDPNQALRKAACSKTVKELSALISEFGDKIDVNEAGKSSNYTALDRAVLSTRPNNVLFLLLHPDMNTVTIENSRKLALSNNQQSVLEAFAIYDSLTRSVKNKNEMLELEWENANSLGGILIDLYQAGGMSFFCEHLQLYISKRVGESSIDIDPRHKLTTPDLLTGMSVLYNIQKPSWKDADITQKTIFLLILGSNPNTQVEIVGKKGLERGLNFGGNLNDEYMNTILHTKIANESFKSARDYILLLQGHVRCADIVSAIEALIKCNMIEYIPTTMLSKEIAYNYTLDQLIRSIVEDKRIPNIKYDFSSLFPSVDFTIKDTEGKTILLLAAKMRAPTMVESLLKIGAEKTINMQDNDGRTALHYACMLGDKMTLDVLLQYGADLNIKDTSDKTPLDYLNLPKHDLKSNIRDILKSVAIDPYRLKNARKLSKNTLDKKTGVKDAHPNSFKVDNKNKSQSLFNACMRGIKGVLKYIENKKLELNENNLNQKEGIIEKKLD